MVSVRNDHSVSVCSQDRALVERRLHTAGFIPQSYKHSTEKIRSLQTIGIRNAQASDFSRKGPIFSLLIPFLDLKGQKFQRKKKKVFYCVIRGKSPNCVFHVFLILTVWAEQRHAGM